MNTFLKSRIKQPVPLSLALSRSLSAPIFSPSIQVIVSLSVHTFTHLLTSLQLSHICSHSRFLSFFPLSPNTHPAFHHLNLCTEPGRFKKYIFLIYWSIKNWCSPVWCQRSCQHRAPTSATSNTFGMNLKVTQHQSPNSLSCSCG